MSGAAGSGLDAGYTAGWILWLLAFAVLEGAAVCRRAKGDTLTEHLRKWLALQSRTRWVGRAALATLLVWLTVHFSEGEIMSPVMLGILKPLLPMLAGPLVTALLKWLMGTFGSKIPDAWKPVVSAAAGAVAAGMTGDVSTLAESATTVVAGAVAGIGGSKARDMAEGKTKSVTPEEFRAAGTDQAVGIGEG